jgi:tetratricopeptide (TPR) repeat protein
MAPTIPNTFIIPTAQDLLLTSPTRSFIDSERMPIFQTPNPPIASDATTSYGEAMKGIMSDAIKDFAEISLTGLPSVTRAQAKLLQRPHHRSRIRADIAARNFEIKLGFKLLQAANMVSAGLEIRDAYGELELINPYSAQSDPNKRFALSSYGAVIETVERLIAANYTTTASKFLVGYMCTSAGIAVPPLGLAVAGAAIAWLGDQYVVKPYLGARRDIILGPPKNASLGPAPTIKSAILKPETVISPTAPAAELSPSKKTNAPAVAAPHPKPIEKHQHQQSELFPTHDPLARQSTWIFSNQPPHPDSEKFTPKAITIGTPEYRTVYGDMEITLGIKNPVGSMVAVAKVLTNTLSRAMASTKEKAEMDLQSAIIQLASADASSKAKDLRRVEAAAKTYAELNRDVPQLSMHGKIILHAAKNQKSESITSGNVSQMTREYYEHYLQLHDKAVADLNSNLSQAEALANEVYANVPELPHASLLLSQVLQKKGDIEGSNYRLAHAEALIGGIQAREPKITVSGNQQMSAEATAAFERSDPMIRQRILLQEKALLVRLGNMQHMLSTASEHDKRTLLTQMANTHNQLIQKDPHNLNYKRGLAITYRNLKMGDKALEVERKVCESHLCTAEDLAAYSDSLIAKNEYEQAEKTLERYLRLKKDDAERQKLLINCRLQNATLRTTAELEKTEAILSGYVTKNPADTESQQALSRLKCWNALTRNTCTPEQAEAHVNEIGDVCFSANGTQDDLILMINMQMRTTQPEAALEMVKSFARTKNAQSYEQVSALAKLSLSLNDPQGAMYILRRSLDRPDCPTEIKDQYNTLVKDTVVGAYHEGEDCIRKEDASRKLGKAMGKLTGNVAANIYARFNPPKPPSPPTPN